MSRSYMTKTKLAIQFIVRRYLEHIFDIEVTDNITKKLEPPYLIIGNHQNNWDPLIMNSFINEQISFVISDEQYRNPIVRNLLQYISAIPTVKAKNDVSTIRAMLKAKKEERIIGLYPEGNRTWDGKTQDIYYSTAKLIKLLQIPVVITIFKGGHLAHPRWSKHRRKGKIFVSYDLLLSVEEIDNMTTDQIYQKLCDGLEYDEIAFQSQQMLPYKGKKLAEGLEDFLFTCPNCIEMEKMESYNNTFSCKACGYSVDYTEYGFFEPNGEKLIYRNTRDWNEWQLDNLKSILTSKLTDIKLLADKNVILKQGEKRKTLQEVSQGEIFVDFNNFHYKPLGGSEIIIPIEQMDGLNLQVKNQLDFYYKNELYRFTFRKSKASPFKWFEALEILQNHLREEKKNRNQAKA